MVDTNFPDDIDIFKLAAEVRAKKMDGSDGADHANEHELLGKALNALQELLITWLDSGIPDNTVVNLAAAMATVGLLVEAFGADPRVWEGDNATALSTLSDDLAELSGSVAADFYVPPSGFGDGYVLTHGPTDSRDYSWQAPVAADPPLGTPRIYKVRVNFDDPGLVSGIAVYTPPDGVTVALLDVWWQTSIPWDGTTPTMDVGTFFGNTHGLFSVCTGPGTGHIDPTVNDDFSIGANYEIGPAGEVGTLTLAQWAVFTARRVVPGFLSGLPLKVVVTQDGLQNGADPEATQGYGYLYISVAEMPANT